MTFKESTFNKTRIAPTPSGHLHLGNVLSFAITAALAEKTRAKILLRIDDMDRDRVQGDYVQDIFDTLRFLDIPWDEGPRTYDEYENSFSQHRRMPMYHGALQKLVDEGHVFACTCTRTDLLRDNPYSIYPGTCRDKKIPLDSPNVNWRIHTDMSQPIAMKTADGTWLTEPLPELMRNFIVRKKDGSPGYQLISLMDDNYFGIDLIVRGEDLLPSSRAQLYLASLLGVGSFGDVAFHHHPLISDAEGQKLSKSKGATSVYHLRAGGKQPSDIYTAIGDLLGLATIINNRHELVALLNSRNGLF